MTSDDFEVIDYADDSWDEDSFVSVRSATVRKKRIITNNKLRSYRYSLIRTDAL